MMAFRVLRWPSRPGRYRQVRLPGCARDRGRLTPFARRWRQGPGRPAGGRRPGAGAWLDAAPGAEGQTGQVGAAAAAGLAPDPVQVRADARMLMCSSARLAVICALVRPGATRTTSSRSRALSCRGLVPGLASGQRLPAGRQHPHIISGRQQPSAQLRRSRARSYPALAAAASGPAPAPVPRPQTPRLLRYPQRRGHHRRDLGPDPVPAALWCPSRAPSAEPARHLTEGQPGLPHPTWPGHRHQPTLTQQRHHVAHRPGPADETGQRSREAPEPPPAARTLSIPTPVP